MTARVHLFTYGTLVFPAIMEALTGRHFQSQSVICPSYRRARLVDRVYPGMIAGDSADTTPGILYFHLDPKSVQILDQYEDDFYERRSVRVQSGSGQTYEAHAYVIPESQKHLMTDQPWSPDEFAAVSYHQYLANCSLFGEKHGKT